MSDLSNNMIFGAALATGLVIAGLEVVTPMVFEKAPPAKPGYIIAVAADTGGGGADVDTPPDWGTVLKTADVSAGQAKTTACLACHSFDASGANGSIGPGLYGVEGRKPGSHAGFAYSAGMVAEGGKIPAWDYQHLYEFLKSPQSYVDGTKMTYAGIKSPQDRINVIAYLHTLGSNLPIPAPNPKAAAPAAGAAAATPAGATDPKAATGAAPAKTAETAPAKAG